MPVLNAGHNSLIHNDIARCHCNMANDEIATCEVEVVKFTAVVSEVSLHYCRLVSQTRAQPRFKSWGSNSTVQNKIRMLYPVSCTAVCYVTVITLFIKKVGVVRPHFLGGGGPDPPDPPPSGCALAHRKHS